jgi:hypothetical protein
MRKQAEQEGNTPTVDDRGYLPPEEWKCKGDPACPVCAALDHAEQTRNPPQPIPRYREGLGQ